MIASRCLQARLASDMVFGGEAFERSPVPPVGQDDGRVFDGGSVSGDCGGPRSGFGGGTFPEVKAKAHVVMEFETGLVLDGHREDEPLPPASMTKMMTEYLVLEKIRSGEIGWEDRVRISPRAAGIDEAQVYLVAGEEWTIRQLFEAMAVYSANDAAVALAEHLAGSEETFVKWMNEKAKELEYDPHPFPEQHGIERSQLSQSRRRGRGNM